jgi:hypothetical protein
MNAFIVWLAYSPLNVFAWVVYIARIAYLIALCWWERSEIMTPSLPDQARAIRSRVKRILRSI